MTIQVSPLILVLSCSLCGAAFAEDAVAEDAVAEAAVTQDARTPGDSVRKEASRTIYSTKGLKPEPKNLQQYQPVTEYIGVEIEPGKRRRGPGGRGKPGRGRDAGEKSGTNK